MLLDDMNTYKITIVREEGVDEITGQLHEKVEEILFVEALSEFDAYRKATLQAETKFFGQIRRTYINDNEYFNPKF